MKNQTVTILKIALKSPLYQNDFHFLWITKQISIEKERVRARVRERESKRIIVTK